VPERIQLRRVRGWRKPADAVVVARPTRWGNPYRLGGEDAAWAVRMFEADLRRSLAGIRTPNERSFLLDRFGDPDTLRYELEGLRGRILACWCDRLAPCHADVLLQIANAEETEGSEVADQAEPVGMGLEEFVARGQAAQAAVDRVLAEVAPGLPERVRAADLDVEPRDDDHGVPAVLHSRDDGNYQKQGTLVRITEPGRYYLHLVRAGDGRVWAALTRSIHDAGVQGEL
jgi:Domain of unknown function (DUF4326)